MKLEFYIIVVQPFVTGLILTKTYYFMYTSAAAEVRHWQGSHGTCSLYKEIDRSCYEQVYWLLVSAFWGTLRLVELRELRPHGEDN